MPAVGLCFGNVGSICLSLLYKHRGNFNFKQGPKVIKNIYRSSDKRVVNSMKAKHELCSLSLSIVPKRMKLTSLTLPIKATIS